MLPSDSAKDAEKVSEEAVAMFNELASKLAKDLGREATREELEYIREKVMLHFFGFYERELVEEEKPETD